MPDNVISERPSADKIVKEVRIETQRTRGVDPSWELFETATSQMCRMRLEPSDGSIVFETNDGVGGGWVAAGGSGGLLGDVVGPASAIDSSVPLYSGTTGKLLKAASGVYVTGTGMGIDTATPQSKLDVQGPAGTGAASAGIITLSTAELTVVDGDQLGRINFNSPLESSGSDAILAGAAIWAEADGTFDATNNATELVFGTATTSAAVERMRIDSAGMVGIGTATPSSTLHSYASITGTSSQQNLINAQSELAGTNSYNSIGRGFQGIYVNTKANASASSTNFNGIYIIPSLDTGSGTHTNITGLQTYTGYGYAGNTQTVTNARGLHVKSWGNITPQTAFTNQYGIHIENITGASNNYAIYSAGGTCYFEGNVGIGTASPDVLVHVSAADGITGVLKIEGGKNIVTATGEINSQLEFGSNDTSVNNTNNIAGMITSITENPNGSLVGMGFHTFYQGVGLTEKLRITSTGNVGIGTASPATGFSLHVVDATSGKIKLEGPQPGVVLRETDASNQEWWLTGLGGTFRIRDITAGSVYPFTIEAACPTNTIYATTAGNVGIGTTAPASGGGAPCLIMVDAVSNPTGIGTNSAGIFAKDVAGTTEFFAIDEAANATQLTAHASDGPDAAYADPIGGRGVEWILRRESPWKMIDGKRVGRTGNLDGCITWENPRTGVTVSESFAEYVTRMGYSQADAERMGYVAQDWDADQQVKQAASDEQQAERAAQWAAVKTEVARQRRLPWHLRKRPEDIPPGPAPKHHTVKPHPFAKVN